MTPDQKKLAIHFFDARGRSILSNDHLEKENGRLRKENTDLKRRLSRLVAKLKSIAERRKEAKDEIRN